MRLLALALAAAGFFEEIPPARSGILWKHTAGRSAARHLPESVGAGAALLDYDNDGWLDLYLVNSGATDFYQPERPLRNALYRNNGNGTFTDRTQQAGVAGGVYGMGVAAGDYDNDGDPDLLVTAHGPILLYRNNGDGTFTEVAAQAGVRIEGWTTSAVWFDYDADGWLDLFVCSFARYRPQDWNVCGKNADGIPFYCIPRRFEPTPSFLFRNNGDGSFAETGRGTAIGSTPGKALGVVTTDVNNDRRLDLFVSNDTVQNFLFVNREAAGKHRWEEIALPAEVAYSADGQARSGMGVDAADWDEDGREDLFVSNVDHEAFSLYRNFGAESYVDVAHEQGLAQATRLLSGWGLKFVDFNNDGTLDLVLANGHPDDMIERHKRNVLHREPLLLFETKDGRLRLAAEYRAMASRGLAAGDWNNDGRTDLLVVNNDEPPALLENRAAGGNWIGLKLQGVNCNRDAIGAVVSYSVNGVKRTRRLNAGGSYLSSHDLRLILGLGAAPAADWVEVRWPAPSNRVQRFAKVAAGRYYALREGEGVLQPRKSETAASLATR